VSFPIKFCVLLTFYSLLLSILQAFPGHKGPVSCLTFRKGSSELFSGSYDRSIKIWNVEDRAYMNTLFGHQSEVLTIDCLWQERVLAVGRDRSMQLFKVYKIMF
jgi:ribosomal RNA-processing protein 9